MSDCNHPNLTSMFKGLSSASLRGGVSVLCVKPFNPVLAGRGGGPETPKDATEALQGHCLPSASQASPLVPSQTTMQALSAPPPQHMRAAQVSYKTHLPSQASQFQASSHPFRPSLHDYPSVLTD